MDVREKLKDILDEFVYDEWYSNDEIADDLITHGVTVQENVEISDELLKQLKNAPITICKEEPSIELVQEWISVNDRLPDKPMKCLVYTKRGECGGYEITYYNQGFNLQYSNVTHWMPLPHPPKGE